MRLRGTVFGTSLLVLGAVCAWTLGKLLPWLNPLLIAVLIGVLMSNVVGIPAQLSAGVKTHGIWLGAGIVLLGASIQAGKLVQGGPRVVVLIATVVIVTVVLVEAVARNVFGVGEQLSSLLAVGTGICGVSAVTAVAGSIDADEEAIAYAAGTVLLFDAATLMVYPPIGAVLSIPDQVFGVWAGLSMFSTGPVVAAGLAHSDVAGQWATVTKLGRNALIGLVALGYVTYYARREADTDTDTGTDGPAGQNSIITTLREEFPKTVLGFLILAAAASAGLLSDGQIACLERLCDWLFLIAFVGLGTELRRSVFSEAGATPITVVLITWSVVATVTLPVTWVLFGAPLHG
jgi:Predicted membrane protein